MKSPKRFRWLAWLAVGCITFLFVLLGTSREINVYDEGLILEGASRVASGELPHRDFYANYGPAQFYILAFLFKAFSPSVLLERLWDALVLAAAFMLILRISLRLMSKLWAIVASITCLLWLVCLGSQACGYPAFPALLFTLLSSALLMRWFEEERSRLHLVCAGLSIGVVTLFRYDVGFFSFVAEALVLASFAHFESGKSSSSRRLMLALFPFATGTAMIFVPVAVLYGIYGMSEDFWFDIVSFPSHAYPKMRGLPFPRLDVALLADRPINVVQLGGKIAQLVVYFLPLAWLITFFFFTSHLHSDPGPADNGLRKAMDKGRIWSIGLLCSLSVILSIKGFVRISAIHMSLAIVPAILLFFIIGDIQKGPRKAATRPLRGIAALVLLFTTTVAAGAVGLNLYRNASWLANSQYWSKAAEYPDAGTCRPPENLERIACFTTSANRIAAVNYVQSNTGENDPVFVGLGRHDKIFVNDMAFYFMAKRRPATKWHHFDPGLQTSEKIQLEMVAELDAVKPRYVILETDWDGVSEPNGSSISSGVFILDDYIHQHYKPSAAFESIFVLERTAS